MSPPAGTWIRPSCVAFRATGISAAPWWSSARLHQLSSRARPVSPSVVPSQNAMASGPGVRTTRLRIFGVRPARCPDWVHELAHFRAAWSSTASIETVPHRLAEGISEADSVEFGPHRQREHERRRRTQQWTASQSTEHRQERPSGRVHWPEPPQNPKDWNAWVKRIQFAQALVRQAPLRHRCLAKNILMDDGRRVVRACSIGGHGCQNFAQIRQHNGPAGMSPFCPVPKPGPRRIFLAFGFDWKTQHEDND